MYEKYVGIQFIIIFCSSHTTHYTPHIAHGSRFRDFQNEEKKNAKNNATNIDEHCKNEKYEKAVNVSPKLVFVYPPTSVCFLFERFIQISCANDS